MILLIVMTVYSIILIIDSVVSTFSKVAVATVIVSTVAIYSNSCGTSNTIRSVSILSTVPSVAHATMVVAPV